MIREEEVTQSVIKWHLLLITFVIGNHQTFRSLLSFLFSGWIDFITFQFERSIGIRLVLSISIHSLVDI